MSHTVGSASLDSEWETWKTTHKKEYNSPGEEAFRRGIWEKTLQKIEKHNQEYELGIHTYTMGMNQFGDMTDEEWNRFLGVPMCKVKSEK
ncbi:cathepsin K-like isoform X2 [Brachyhypopomus gauderio]|uniref:cathepsin K-like isoform X2 n=1 Tax=Brachyhypopomus gauderio TaxID=698409 RepID=UPI0040432524